MLIQSVNEIRTMFEVGHQMEHTEEEIACAKCGNTEGTFINLQCDHLFCILCAAFMYAKSRKSLIQEDSIKCFVCKNVTELAQQYIDLINQTLQNQVIPNIDSMDKLTVPKNCNLQGNKYIQTISRKIKSQEHSFEHNGTPSTAKCFFSKCESPSSRKRHSNSNGLHCCNTHHSEPITHLCLSCDIKPLCIKCISNSKRHFGHELKELPKAILMLSEQLSMNLIEVNNKMQDMELFQRRLDERANVVKDRGTKYLTQIRDGFSEIFHRLEEKEQQVIKNCQDHFAGLIQQMNEENQRISDAMSQLKNFKEKIAMVQRSSGGLDLVNKFVHLKRQMSQVSQNKMEFHLEKRFQMPSSLVKREISEIQQRIASLRVTFKFTNFCRIGASQIENCTSEGKLKKDSQSKRVKTNFGSLNSSRQKRDKKYTKTEEDEKKLKNQKISKTFEREKKGKVPTYISDFINKKSSKMGSDGSSYNMEMTVPNLEGTSKITSKLSKTISPEDMIRRKKQHHAVIKERIERKTTQPTTKASSKKKRNY